MSRPESDRNPATPRWVKVFAAVALLAIVVVVILLLSGVAGEHGPSRHAFSTLLDPQ